jgi:predicted alpha-1,2-mannosidase
MLKGAEEECRSPNGEYLERQGLGPYLARGYVPYDLDTNTRNANSLIGSPDDVWGSASTTLEYAVDDFAIAQFAARALHDRTAYGRLIRRSGNWRKLFDKKSGTIEPRYENGSFPAEYSNLNGGGFVEGNSLQYTWMVPQDPSGLFREMGGRDKATSRLRRFLRKLNGGAGGTHTDHALLGNEPTLHVPWLYDWARRPYGTQAAVRRALRLYGTSPDGYPGNDDLGTLSSWYVFGALGLYPEVPGVGLLAIGSPLFERASIALPRHRRATISAGAYAFRRSRHRGGRHGKSPKARRVALSPSAVPYIRSLKLNGHPYGKPWTTYCALARGAHLSFQLGPHPDRGWGASAAALPPSFGPHRRMPRNNCTP